jgi:hypothetical protein
VLGFFGIGWFFGFGWFFKDDWWFFTDPGGFSDLDNPRLIFVVLRIRMVFLWTWLVFSGDMAVFLAYDHSTHILVRTALAGVTGKRKISIYFLCIGRA